MRCALLVSGALAWLRLGACAECDNGDEAVEDVCALQLGGRPPASERSRALASGGAQAGAQIPLGVHPLVDDVLHPDDEGPSSPAMTVDVSPVTSGGRVLPAQRVLFDTGSAGLAFCNNSFAGLLSDLQTPGLVPCKSYGGPGNWVSGYWGKVYTGGLEMGGVPVHGAHYAVMQQDIGMPCRVKGFMGIFGAAFQVNYKLWQTTADISEPLWAPGKVDSCETSIPGVTGMTTLVPPMEQLVTELAGEKVQRLGIYWSGLVGDSVGMLYLNSAAMHNPHYARGSAQRARLRQGKNGEFNIFIKSMTAGGITFTGFPCTAEDLQHYCILDTGSGATVLPKEVADAIGDGTLEVELQGVRKTDPPVKLSFDMSVLNKVKDGPIEGVPVPINESFTMLGFPTWALYYTVFSSGGYVDFVPHAYPDHP